MKAAHVISSDAVKVTMEAPVVVDQSAPELSKEWGYWRMPKVYRMPTGEIGLTFSVSADHYYDQGRTSPVFLSRDDGRTWGRSSWPHPGISGMGPVITPVLDGEFYTIPAPTGLELDLKRMPKPVGTMALCAGFHVYPLGESPDDVVRWFEDIKAMRWSPATRAWSQEQVEWDHRGQLVFCYNDTPQKNPGDWTQKIYLESPIIRSGRELLHADYWIVYETRPGHVPPAWESSLMVSTDNGRSWTRRSTMAPAEGKENMCEPVIEMNQAGELVGLMRVETSTTLPAMRSVFSRDQGHTWSESQTVHGYGVFPRLLQLQNGVLVLSYGRAPGTWMTFSLDGGHSWTQPHNILPSDHEKGSSCGYTSLLALDAETFLIAYGDRHLPNAQGEPCKSILARRISVRV